MWGKIPLFEASLPFHYPSSCTYHKGSIFSNRSKGDTKFKEQLNDIRQMGMNLADSNRRIGQKIFLNAQKMERRQRLRDDLQPTKRLYEPNRRLNYYILSHISDVSSSSSYSFLRARSFDLLQDSYDDISFSSESSYHWSSDLLTSDTLSSQISEISLSDFLDDESSFDIFGPSYDVLVLNDMLNTIFGNDTIYQIRTRKSVSGPMTVEGKSFESAVPYGSQFNVEVNSSVSNKIENSSSKILEDPKYSRTPSEPVRTDEARKKDRRASKQTKGRNVVEKILDSVITDVENSREQLKWN